MIEGGEVEGLKRARSRRQTRVLNALHFLLSKIMTMLIFLTREEFFKLTFNQTGFEDEIVELRGVGWGGGDSAQGAREVWVQRQGREIVLGLSSNLNGINDPFSNSLTSDPFLRIIWLKINYCNLICLTKAKSF